jgi:hypothetical protein
MDEVQVARISTLDHNVWLSFRTSYPLSEC